MEEIINNCHVRVSHSSWLLEIAWKEHCDSGDFRSVMTEVSRIAGEKRITRWLCDMRLLRNMLPADQYWLAGKLLPTLTLREEAEHRLAYLISPSNLELMSSLAIRETAQRNPLLEKYLEVGLFTRMEQAVTWLN